MDSVNSSRWSIDETKILLSMWSEENIQDQLDGTVRDGEVYKKLERMMKEKSFNRSSSQIRTRIKVLKRNYREQKDKLKTTGQSGKIKFKFYAQMDSVLGHREGTEPTGVLETSIPGLDNNGTLQHTIDEHPSIISSMEVEDEEILDSDLDTTLHSVNGDQSILALAEELDGQGGGNDENLNDSVVESQPGPSTASKDRRKRKTLKEILPQTMERCVESFINYQKEMDKEYLDMEKEQLKVEKESLELKREALEIFKRVFQ